MIADRVTVVVLTYNRCREVLRTLAELARVVDGAPIVVVDNASTDGTAAAIADAHRAVRVVRLATNCGAAA
ncbi:MAG TPA: glycosyltransferase, partial [Casimicrobiaceae bacterium]|nr:glycosyltransferase [Casimicrobiaceae bacterium]